MSLPYQDRISGHSDSQQNLVQQDFDRAHHMLSFNTTKWSVFLIAALTAISGLVLVCLGIYSLSSESTVLGHRTLPLIMLILGALVFLISFVGIFGTVTQSRGLLYGFLVGLLMLIIAQLVIGIIALANQGAVDNLLDDAWQNAYDHHPRIIRDVQEERGCCGFRFTTDRAIPKSSPDACLKSIEFGHQVACMRLLIGPYRRLQYIIGISGIILAGLQIVAVFLSYLMLEHLPDSKQHHGCGYRAPIEFERQQLLGTDAHGNLIPTLMDVGNNAGRYGTRCVAPNQRAQYAHDNTESLNSEAQKKTTSPLPSVPAGELNSTDLMVNANQGTLGNTCEWTGTNDSPIA